MRTFLLLSALLCAFALLAAPAGAATVVTTAGPDVTVTAADGIENDVTIGPGDTPGTVRITETKDALSDPGAACTAVGTDSIDCAATGRVSLALGDESDDLAAGASPVPVTVDAGGGDDTLGLANSLVDAVTCGPGDDNAADTDSDDLLDEDCEETPATAGPPQTSIVEHPSADSDSDTATFTLDATETATFECKLDDAAFGDCPATPSFAGLTDGSHTLLVRATDHFANTDPTPAVYTWLVDTAPPVVSFSRKPPSATKEPTADFTFTAEEPVTGVECRLDAHEWAPCDTPSTVTYGALDEGRHTVAVHATDIAGNLGTATYSWTVDQTGPTAGFAVAPATLSNDGTPDFAFSVSEGGARFECALDGAAMAACSAAPTFRDLRDGPHTLEVQATDALGNLGPATTYTWTQDVLRPQTQLVAGPASSIAVNSPSATFTFASEAGVRFECSLDGGGWQACSSPITYTGLANGAHSFAVRAVDAAGNADGTPPARAWNVRVDGAPTAAIAVTRDGDGFALSAAGSSDPEGGALVYRWLRNGTAAGATATVHYAAPDHETRDVFTVTVTDPNGQRGQATVGLRTRTTTETTAHEAVEVVRFGAGARLAAGARARIAALRAAIGAGRATVRIEGYAQPGAGAARVAKARAQEVRAPLVKGISPAPTVTVAGRGASSPAASNATPAGRARNDRVVVTVRFSGPAPRLVTQSEGTPAVSRANGPQPAAAASGPAPKLFAFYSAVPGALRRLEEVGSRVDVLAPNWFTLSPATGAIRGGRPNARVMALSRTLGFKVWPVVNATIRGSALIDTAAGRAKVVDRITALAAKNRLAGVTLDMEEMLPRQKASYSALVAQLASALHAKGRKLAVYAVRRTATEVDNGAAAYDWGALARSANLVLASGYNEHSAVTAAGPVSTQAGFGALASYAAATSRTKVVPTMGAFGYAWTGSSARMVSSTDAERRSPGAAEVGGADEREQTTGATRTFFETAEDLWAREQAARRAGSRWIGLFTLGREPERFWERSAIR